MRRIGLVLVLSLLGSVAVASSLLMSQEVLVQTTPTLLPTLERVHAYDICNLGPNRETCVRGLANSDGGAPVYPDGGLTLDGAHPLEAYVSGTPADCWSFTCSPATRVWCQASTADQVHDAATAVDMAVDGY